MDLSFDSNKKDCYGANILIPLSQIIPLIFFSYLIKEELLPVQQGKLIVAALFSFPLIWH
jgi:hypothetical protein